MSNELLAEDLHPASQRRALIACEPGSVWLYLTKPASHDIAADCWLLNHGEAPASELLRGEGAPPPAPYEEIEPGGYPETLPAGFDLLWADEGHTVAACADGVVLGFIVEARGPGQSRYLRHPGPWGRPFIQDDFSRAFGG